MPSMIQIDPNDDPRVLRALRVMLTTLINSAENEGGEVPEESVIQPHAPYAAPDVGPTEIVSEVDHNGAAFNEQFCGKSAEPFYTSGARLGQWKKRRGVDDKDYDAWYQSAKPSPAQTTGDTTGPVDTAAAFVAPEPAAVVKPASNIPQTCGDFLAWTAELIAAQRLNHQQIGEAYAINRLGPMDLFPPTPDNIVAERVALLHNTITSLIGG